MLVILSLIQLLQALSVGTSNHFHIHKYMEAPQFSLDEQDGDDMDAIEDFLHTQDLNGTESEPKTWSHYLDTCQPNASSIEWDKWMGRGGNKLHQIVNAFSFAWHAGRSTIKLPTRFETALFRMPWVLTFNRCMHEGPTACKYFQSLDRPKCSLMFFEGCESTVKDRRAIYVNQIKPYLRKEVVGACDAGREDTIVIHVRDGDISRDLNGSHRQPPCRYFHEVIEKGNGGAAFPRVLLVHSDEEPTNLCVADITAKHRGKLVPHQSNIRRDACTILKAKNLALTSSSFGITLAMMNTDVDRLFHVDTLRGNVGFDLYRRKEVNFELHHEQRCKVFPNSFTFVMDDDGSVGGSEESYFLNFASDKMHMQTC